MTAVTTALAQIVAAITSAVTPPSDASGGTVAPKANCSRPNTADDPEHGERDEHAAPRRHREQQPTEQRRADRRHAQHQRDEREHPGHLGAVVQVADHRPRDDDARAACQPADQAQREQYADGRVQSESDSWPAASSAPSSAVSVGSAGR
jgi:hypothetical protein